MTQSHTLCSVGRPRRQEWLHWTGSSSLGLVSIIATKLSIFEACSQKGPAHPTYGGGQQSSLALCIEGMTVCFYRDKGQWG